MIRLLRTRPSDSRSSSPVTMQKASPATASSRTRSSFGSRQIRMRSYGTTSCATSSYFFQGDFSFCQARIFFKLRTYQHLLNLVKKHRRHEQLTRNNAPTARLRTVSSSGPGRAPGACEETAMQRRHHTAMAWSTTVRTMPSPRAQRSGPVPASPVRKAMGRARGATGLLRCARKDGMVMRACILNAPPASPQFHPTGSAGTDGANSQCSIT